MKCKRLIALILLLAVTLSLTVPVAAAESVPGTVMSSSEKYAAVLRQMWITAGLEGAPETPVTRAEFCVMVIRAMGREDEIALHSARTIFRDVTASHWARGYINLASSITVGGGTGSRLVAGVGTGQFKPDAPINYAQAVTILVRMLGYGDDKAGAIWPNGYLTLASSLGVTTGVAAAAYGNVTRAQAAILMGNALYAKTAGGEVYYKTIKGVTSTRSAVVLDVNARNGETDGLLRVYFPAGGTVEELRQVEPVSDSFTGYAGELLLNGAGSVVAFLAEQPAAKSAVLTAADRKEITAGSNYSLASDAVIIVGTEVYRWAETGYLQAKSNLGGAVWLLCDDVGDVSCVYLPVEDPARAAALAVAEAKEVLILDTAAREGTAADRLKVYAAGDSAPVTYYAQAVPLAAKMEGKNGLLLLNSKQQVVGFVSDGAAAAAETLRSAAKAELKTDAGTYELTSDAVIIVGDRVYAWKETGWMQAACYLGSRVRVLKDETGYVSCVYLPVADAREEVKGTQTAILLKADDGHGEVMAYTVGGSSSGVEHFAKTEPLSSAYEGRLGELLLNEDDEVVGFLPSVKESEEVTVASAKRSGIVDAEGVTHRIPGSAVAVVGDTAYPWKDTGYLQIGSHSGKTVRLYHDDKGAVAYVCLFSGGTSAETEAIVAETVTAAGELVRRLGLTGSFSITKNGAAAQREDLGQYDVAYYDAVSRTLRASDRQFTGYVESVYPNMAEAETITVSGNEFEVLESAWESLAVFGQKQRVTLLLTDDGKVAAATADKKIAAEQLGVLSADGTAITLLSSGRTLTPKKLDAKENLYGRIVKVSVYQDEVRCTAYTTDTVPGALKISDGMLGEYALAPVCAVYEHTGSETFLGHVRGLSGKVGEASYDFNEIFWTDVIPAHSVTAYHLNSAGKVDMILLRDVTGNAYTYGMAAKYTGEEGINLGDSFMSAYNSAVTVTNSDGESVKRLCSLYDAKTGAWVGVSEGTYNAEYQRVVSLKVLREGKDVKNTDFFLSGEKWYAVANEAEIPVSGEVQVYLESTKQWQSGEEALKTALAMGETMTVYYDRAAASGGQIRIIVVEK